MTKIYRFARLGCALSVLIMLITIGPTFAQDAITVTDANGEEVTIEDTSRIITIDGSITEIVFALGMGDQVVARDDSSLYPSVVEDLESVGYVRRLSAEPVLALDPTLIITSTSVGPVEAVEQLEASGVTFLVLPSPTDVAGVIDNIQTIAAALDKETEGESLVQTIETDYATAQALLDEQVETTPRVMFIYARGAGAVTVAGTNTSANEMIELAGAENAITEFEDFQPITAEAVVTAAPDVILMMTNGLESLGGIDGLLEQPGIVQTPAGENRRIVAMEDLYLLGFSTRIGTAVLDLTYLLHEEVEPPILTILRADGRFNTLLRGITIAGQADLLNSASDFTIFAPTDEAFEEAFPPEVLEGFFGSAISVQATLSGHILDETYMAEDLAALDGEMVETLLPDTFITVTVDDEGILLNGSVPVIEADQITANGVIHVIDGLLLPERP
ncbi:MAG: ABC transporter substrate-binding protein [Anaerolineales bacterium]